MKFLKKFFRRREYECFVFLAGQDSPKPWESETWNQLAQLLDPFIQGGEGAPHISVRGWASPEAKALRERVQKYPRLAWSPRSFSQWTLGANDQRLFHELELILPSLEVCKKRSILPSLFLLVVNEATLIPNPKIPYQVIWCTEQTIFHQLGGAGAVANLLKLLDPARAFHKVRPWGYLFGSSATDTAGILDYGAIMPMYEQRLGRPIGPPQHGWVDLISDKEIGA